tara:strand:+ start:5019 stop:5297 length:279 start_codon:yes stop_codon:yes gene_type:complete
MKIKKSARMKKRYLLIEGATRKEIQKYIVEGIGAIGYAKAAPSFIGGVKSMGAVVLCVERKAVEPIKESFSLVRKKIKVKKVSGTLKGLGVR